MKIYDKIKSMNQTEMAQFISDLLCGNSTDLIKSFDDCLCVDCTSAGSILNGEVHECCYPFGNCNGINNVKKWLESEVEEYV